MSFVRNNSEFVHYCGAAVITPTYSLTAGHCIDTMIESSEKTLLLFGASEINGNSPWSIVRKVNSVTYHPKYKKRVIFIFCFYY